MKQTVEEAAINYVSGSFWSLESEEVKDLVYEGFVDGAKWQAEQSSWINVKEQLPDEQKMVLCMMKSNNAIVSGYITVPSGHKPTVLTAPNFEFEDLMDYEPIAWMPMPPLSD